MILYYTYKQKTKVFAQTLGDVLSLPTYELKSDINDKSGFGFIFNALMLTFTGKSYPVSNVPEDMPLEIYVCSPIWGGRLAAPVKYFLENSNLQRTRVNLLLTASIPTEKYRQKALEYLQKLNCTPGDVYLFATSDKVMPDGEVLKEQLYEILGVEMPKDKKE